MATLSVRIIMTSFPMSPIQMVQKLQDMFKDLSILDSHKHWVIASLHWNGTWDALRDKINQADLQGNCHLMATDNDTFFNEDYGIEPIPY